MTEYCVQEIQRRAGRKQPGCSLTKWQITGSLHFTRAAAKYETEMGCVRRQTNRNNSRNWSDFVWSKES